MRKNFSIGSSSKDQLLKLGKLVLCETEIDRVLEIALDNVIELTHADRGLIILFDQKGDTIIQTARNLSKTDIENPKFEISRTIIQNVQTECKPICYNNAMKEPILKSSQSTIRLRILSVICVPLIIKESIIGVIYLDNKRIERAFKKELCNFLIDFADFISSAADNALMRKMMQNKVSGLELELRGKYHFESIIGHHSKMIEILKLLSQVAIIDATVLIQGESGTGKELIGQALHYNSYRRDKSFVPVNCGAIPENLLESELFGHVRGAFTGAIANKIGLFGRADGGTIFLDEISEMSPALQTKLLRVIESGEYCPVGSSIHKFADLRIIAATNKDLGILVSKEIFREDLFYRLNIIDIFIPPLRDRSSDIELLSEHFLKIYSAKYNKNNLYFSEESIKYLIEYDYPGNVRELENIIQRAVALAVSKKIAPKNLFQNISKNMNIISSNNELSNFKKARKNMLEKFELDYVNECLKIAHGNISKASKIAGIQYANFHKKIKKYKVTPSDFKID